VKDFTKSKAKRMNARLLIPILLTAGIAVSAEKLPGPDIRLTNIVQDYSDKRLFGNPTGIFLEPTKQEVYLADAGNHQIGIFDLQGSSLWSFRHWVTDDREGGRSLGDPHSVVVTGEGEIIVSDNKADYLDIFDYRGNFLRKIDPLEFPEPTPFRGAVLALDKAGNLYIGTNVEKSEIIKLDRDYQFVMKFGRKGEEPQDFDNISGIWIDNDGNILITDALSTPVLKKYSPTGEYLAGFGGRTIEQADFSLPSGVATTAGGRIWVVDQLRQVVKCLSASGEYETMIGGMGNTPGAMYYPSAVASDGDSLLIVVEKNGNRFQQFVIK
jgi:tripartite motif-containing protein 71